MGLLACRIVGTDPVKGAGRGGGGIKRGSGQGFPSLELWEAKKQTRQNHRMTLIDHESAKTRWAQ